MLSKRNESKMKNEENESDSRIIVKRTMLIVVMMLAPKTSGTRMIRIALITALFNNMRTLKLKAQPTNAFFATVNQMFGGSSQLPTMLSELYSTI